MYDELVKRIRQVAEEVCEDYDVDPYNAEQRFFVIEEAADAIEGLSREVEEYKAAYRKEHNKRIAENKYLYDELTKAVRAKFLMTPMRIEVPEPPKEG